jgi:hypothetical protein
MTRHPRAESSWFVFAELPTGEKLEPGKTEGCAGPDVWGQCPALEAGREPGCAGATWYYGPEPRLRVEVSAIAGTCPFVMLDPEIPASIPLD